MRKQWIILVMDLAAPFVPPGVPLVYMAAQDPVLYYSSEAEAVRAMGSLPAGKAYEARAVWTKPIPGSLVAGACPLEPAGLFIKSEFVGDFALAWDGDPGILSSVVLYRTPVGVGPWLELNAPGNAVGYFVYDEVHITDGLVQDTEYQFSVAHICLNGAQGAAVFITGTPLAAP